MGPIDQLIGNFFKEHASVLFFCCDKDGVVKRTNRYTRKILGSDVKGKRLADIFVDFYNAFVLEEFLKEPDRLYLFNVSTAIGLPQTYYFRFYRTEEDVVVFGESDSEEMDHLRRNLLILNNELNNFTRELHKKNAELTRLNDIKNQLLGMAAHDLRTPIGAIKTYSEFVLDETRELLDEEIVSLLTTIRSLSDFMIELINNLLDLSAIEAGKLRFETKPISIVGLLRESLEITSIFAGKKGIEIDLDCKEEGLTVLADPIRIRQVVDNLLTNAIKFSGHGSKVTLKVVRNNNYALVSVADEGPGVPQAEIDRLFKPFSVTSTKPSGGEKGTGLGLAIAKKIIDSHRGTIWVENRVPHGAVFSFTLPIAE